MRLIGGVTFEGNVVLQSGAEVEDDQDLGIGTGSPYYWRYNSGVGQMELWSTDVDGGGSDGLIMSAADGDDDVVFAGNVSAQFPTLDDHLATKEYVDIIPMATLEPSGHVDRNESTIAFDDLTRTFTISPVGADFTIFTRGGVRRIRTTPESIQIPDVEGIYFFYIDENNTLQYSTSFSLTEGTVIQQVYCAVIYWDAANSSAIYFGDERHGMVMDWGTHSYLHTTIGTKWISGGALTSITADGSGDDAVAAEFAVSGTNIADEDIPFSFTNGAPQNIDFPAEIPVYYRTGSTGAWRKKTADTYPIIYSGTAGYTGANGRLPYNQFTGGAWQLTEIGNNNYVLVHYYATNDVSEPIIAVQGQEVYTTISTAQAGAEVEINTLSQGALPFQEFAPLGSVIFQTATSYANTPKARVRSTDSGDDYVDFRGVPSKGSGGLTISDHGLLSGLGDDDHPQYLLIDGTRAMTGALLGFDGTEALPGFAFATQPSTGIYLAGADDVRVSVGGTYRIRFTTSQIECQEPINIHARLFNSSGVLNLGTAAGSTHGLTTGDVVIGGQLEVDGQTNFDNHFNMGDNVEGRWGAGNDYFMEYITGAAPGWEMRTNDSDGVGTDAELFYFKDGEPHFYMGSRAQGARFDTSVDSRLTLKDEAGGDIDLQLGVGQKLILDDDGDSYIWSSTDDNVLLYAGLNLVFSGSSNSLNIYRNTNWGSGNASLTGGGSLTMYGGLISDATRALALGTDASTSHGLVTGDVVVGGALEVDGTLYADGDARLADDTDLVFGSGIDYWWTYNSTATRMEMFTTDADGLGANQVLMWFNDGESYTYMGKPTQSVRFDTTTDGYLKLTDESGGALYLQTNRLLWNDGGAYLSPTQMILGLNDFTISTSSSSGYTRNLSIGTGNGTGVADMVSGTLALYTGYTTTDGDTGDITLTTGAAGAGAADAGDIIMSVNGVTQGLMLKGADAQVYLGTATQGVKLDTSTDGYLALTDESGADLLVTSAGFRTPASTATAVSFGGGSNPNTSGLHFASNSLGISLLGTNRMSMSLLTTSFINTPVSISQQLIISAASAAAPSWYFSGDPDTGMYQAAPNVMGFAAGGSGRLTIGTAYSAHYNDLDQQGVITNNAGALNLGTTAATSHGLASGDVLVGGRLETNGLSYFDDTVNVAANSQINLGSRLYFEADNVADQSLLGLWSSGGYQLVITDVANITKDHDHATPSTPTVYIHSGTDPDVDNTEWLSLAFGEIATGSGHLKLSPAGGGVKLGIGTALILDDDEDSWIEASGDDVISFYVLSTQALTLNPTNGLTLAGVNMIANDNRMVQFGTGLDYWAVYNSSSTRMEFWSSDSDGIGTDQVLFWAVDGASDFYLGAPTQAIKFDTSVDSVLSLEDESSGSVTLLTHRTSVNNGSIASPGYSFAAGDVFGGTGIYCPNDDNLRIAIKGTNIVTFGTTIQFESNIRFPDNKKFYFGSGSDYWMTYTPGIGGVWELVSNNSDGSGTDALLMYAKDTEPYLYLGTIAQGARFDNTVDGVMMITDESGGDLAIRLGTGSASNPVLRAQDADSGIYFNSTDGALCVTHNSTHVFAVRSTGIQLGNVSLQRNYAPLTPIIESGDDATVDTYPLYFKTGDEISTVAARNSGQILLETGDISNTLGGVTGDITLRVGVSAGGSSSEGSIFFQTAGTNTRMEIDGVGDIYIERGIGLWGATPPASQPAAISDVPTGGSATAADNATAINSILAALRGAGIIAT